MKPKYLLGIDIGTSSCKLSVFSIEGKILFHNIQPYATYFPKQDHIEQDPLDWWNAVVVSIQKLRLETTIDVQQISAIGVAGQSGALVALDQDGEVIRRAMIWLDRRSQEQCDEVIAMNEYDSIRDISLNPISTSYVTSKLQWLQKYEPETIERLSHVLQSNGYIVYRLTGQLSQDYSQANGLHCFNMKLLCWDQNIANLLGINHYWLPPLVSSSAIVGHITEQISQLLGLPAGIPVVAGGLDAACATLGIGAIHVGQVQEQGGQAGGMSIVTMKPISHPKLILSPHVIEGRYLLQGGTVGGGSLNWFRREYYADHPNFFEFANEQAATIRAGSEGVLFVPYMSGERSPIWDTKAKGMFIGLTYEMSHAHMIRSIMEGCVYSLQHNLETAAELAISIDTLHCVGGAANSEVWTQIKADITGKQLRIAKSNETTTLGAAMLAGIGVGIFQNAEEAVERMVFLKQKIYVPNPDNQLKYNQIFQTYKKVYPQMKEIYEELDGV